MAAAQGEIQKYLRTWAWTLLLEIIIVYIFGTYSSATKEVTLLAMVCLHISFKMPVFYEAVCCNKSIVKHILFSI